MLNISTLLFSDVEANRKLILLFQQFLFQKKNKQKRKRPAIYGQKRKRIFHASVLMASQPAAAYAVWS